MTAKISNELLQECKRAEQADPACEIPVIVTISGQVDPAELEKKGLRITHVFEPISAVSGTLTPAEIEALAGLDQVTMSNYISSC